jgi:hypothetical protein
MRSTSSGLSPFTSSRLDLSINSAIACHMNINSHNMLSELYSKIYIFMWGLGNSCLVMLGLNNEGPYMHRKTDKHAKKKKQNFFRKPEKTNESLAVPLSCLLLTKIKNSLWQAVKRKSYNSDALPLARKSQKVKREFSSYPHDRRKTFLGWDKTSGRCTAFLPGYLYFP